MPFRQDEKLISKKNNVYKKECLINGKKLWVVEKEFTDTRRFFLETKIIKELSRGDLAVPKTLFNRSPGKNGQGAIIYEFIDGITALDFISRGGLRQGRSMLNEITRWLADYYALVKRAFNEQWILGDAHLRNFIYNENSGKLYGLDFENACPGRIEQDIARLFLFIITYEPAYSSKHLDLAAYLAGSAVTTFNLDKTVLLREMSAEAQDMSRRRNIHMDEAFLAEVMESGTR